MSRTSQLVQISVTIQFNAVSFHICSDLRKWGYFLSLTSCVPIGTVCALNFFPSSAASLAFKRWAFDDLLLLADWGPLQNENGWDVDLRTAAKRLLLCNLFTLWSSSILLYLYNSYDEAHHFISGVGLSMRLARAGHHWNIIRASMRLASTIGLKLLKATALSLQSPETAFGLNS